MRSSSLDSLKKVVARASDDTNKVTSLVHLANALYFNMQTQKAIQTAHQANQLAEQLDYNQGIGDASSVLGNIYKHEGKTLKSLSYYRRSLRFFQRIKDLRRIERVNHNIGSIYERMGNYPQALLFYQKSFKIAEQFHDKRRMANALNAMGNLYFVEVKYDESLKYYQQSLAIYQSNRENESEVPSILNNIGNIYYQKKEYLKALEYYNKCLQLEKDKKDQSGVAQTLGNIGNVYQEKAEYPKALEYYLQSYEIHQKIDDPFGMTACHINLCNIYLYLKEFKKAHQHGQIALKQAQSLGHLEMKKLSAQNLVAADSALGDFASAYRHLRLFQNYTDSLSNADQSREMGRLEAQFKYEKKLEEHEKQKAIEAERQTLISYLFAGGLFFTLIITGIVFFNYRSKVKTNHVLSEQNNQIRQQKEDIDHKTRKIEDSIRYAYQIQTAILPDSDYLKAVLPRHFIFYQPKDIVSGDFYWVSKRDDKIFFCVADCTGHGVPGAFMSVVGSNAFHSAVNELGLTKPDDILEESDKILRRTLHQESHSESKDGMDVSFCMIHEQKLSFAGAGRPLLILRSGELIEIKGDKFPVGGGQFSDKSFTLHEIPLQSGDRIYLFSDGITDQFGGENKKKFTPKRLKEFILLYQFLPIDKQGQIFQQEFGEWTKGQTQLDDWSLMGIQI